MKNLIIVLFALLVGCADGDDMSKSSWSQSGNLRTGEGVNGGISCQADLGEGHGDIYTVQFGIVLPPTTPPIIVRPEALVTLTVNGCDVVRRISVNDGTSISGTAEKFKAKLFDSLTAAMPGVLGLQYTANIQISKGVRPPVQQPPYLNPDTYTDAAGIVHPYIGTITIAAAATATVPIPVNAGIISTMVMVPPNTPAFASTPRVQQVSGAGILAEYDPTLYNFVPLFPGTDRLILLASVGDVTDFVVLFGVDG